MKKTKTIAALFQLLILSACGPTIHKSANFNNSKSSVKILAFLPFNISIDGKRLPKGTSIETLKMFQEKTGYDIQIMAYTTFLQMDEDYTVTFQDIDKTNALLKKENITFDKIALQDKSELCKMLGVDGIISGKATMSRPMSEGSAAAATVAVNALTLLFGGVGGVGSTNKITMALTVHDKSGTLLWKCDDKIRGSVGSSADSLTKVLMEIASMKFPYKK